MQTEEVRAQLGDYLDVKRKHFWVRRYVVVDVLKGVLFYKDKQDSHTVKKAIVLQNCEINIGKNESKKQTKSVEVNVVIIIEPNEEVLYLRFKDRATASLWNLHLTSAKETDQSVRRSMFVNRKYPSGGEDTSGIGFPPSVSDKMFSLNEEEMDDDVLSVDTEALDNEESIVSKLELPTQDVVLNTPAQNYTLKTGIQRDLGDTGEIIRNIEKTPIDHRMELSGKISGIPKLFEKEKEELSQVIDKYVEVDIQIDEGKFTKDKAMAIARENKSRNMGEKSVINPPAQNYCEEIEKQALNMQQIFNEMQDNISREERMVFQQKNKQLQNIHRQSAITQRSSQPDNSACHSQAEQKYPRANSLYPIDH